jgi:hypothetical protein
VRPGPVLVHPTAARAQPGDVITDRAGPHHPDHIGPRYVREGPQPAAAQRQSALGLIGAAPPAVHVSRGLPHPVLVPPLAGSGHQRRVRTCHDRRMPTPRRANPSPAPSAAAGTRQSSSGPTVSVGRPRGRGTSEVFQQQRADTVRLTGAGDGQCDLGRRRVGQYLVGADAGSAALEYAPRGIASTPSAPAPSTPRWSAT